MSEPWLRIRARRLRGIISVPHLLGDGGLAVPDSFAIAREADRIGGGPALVPPELLEAITIWNDRADRLMRAGLDATVARGRRAP